MGILYYVITVQYWSGSDDDIFNSRPMGVGEMDMRPKMKGQSQC